jgi:hypothetical protein
MIDLEIDTSRFAAKIRNAKLGIEKAIARGLSDGSENWIKQTDEFMFAPLAFVPEVSERSNETTATIGVNLNLPPKVTFRRTSFNRFNRFRKRKTVNVGKRSWKDYVRDLGRESGPEMADAVETAIKEELR